MFAHFQEVKALSESAKNTCAGRHSGAVKKNSENYAVGCAERKIIPGSSAARRTMSVIFFKKKVSWTMDPWLKVAKSKL